MTLSLHAWQDMALLNDVCASWHAWQDKALFHDLCASWHACGVRKCARSKRGEQTTKPKPRGSRPLSVEKDIFLFYKFRLFRSWPCELFFEWTRSWQKYKCRSHSSQWSFWKRDLSFDHISFVSTVAILENCLKHQVFQEPVGVLQRTDDKWYRHVSWAPLSGKHRPAAVHKQCDA